MIVLLPSDWIRQCIIGLFNLLKGLPIIVVDVRVLLFGQSVIACFYLLRGCSWSQIQSFVVSAWVTKALDEFHVSNILSD